MSNKTQLQTNNSALDGYIARINAAKEVVAGLPEAGGSDGGSVETCTVILKNGDDQYDYFGYTATVFTNGEVSADYDVNSEYRSPTDVTITNVVCGTVMTVYVAPWIESAFAIDGDATLEFQGTYRLAPVYFFVIGKTAGSTVTITIYGSD
jgi:hypothetical protein